MAIAVACHAGSVTGSGAVFAVVAHLGVVESHRIRRREWSRIMAVNTACQGVMGSRRVRRREWSSVVRYCGLPGSADPSAKVWQRSELMTESGSRRSPGGVLLAVGVVGGARLP